MGNVLTQGRRGVVCVLVRIPRITLAAIIALPVAGCGGDKEDGPTQPGASLQTTAEAQAPPDTTLPAEPSAELVQAPRRDAVAWASLFADTGCTDNKYMAEPMCERLGSVPAAFRKSFAAATVKGVEHMGMEEVGPPAGSIYVAAVTFSNGVVVVFGGGRPEAVRPDESCPGDGSGCVWKVEGPERNRAFMDAATG